MAITISATRITHLSNCSSSARSKNENTHGAGLAQTGSLGCSLAQKQKAEICWSTVDVQNYALEKPLKFWNCLLYTKKLITSPLSTLSHKEFLYSIMDSCGILNSYLLSITVPPNRYIPVQILLSSKTPSAALQYRHILLVVLFYCPQTNWLKDNYMFVTELVSTCDWLKERISDKSSLICFEASITYPSHSVLFQVFNNLSFKDRRKKPWKIMK